ncbi:MAG: DNA-processing protein DprA [Mogibacterium sp.]|nr:DNA-processing protein DprA [Mogibacterium sp.]
MNSYENIVIIKPKWRIGNYRIEKIYRDSTDYPEKLRNIPESPDQLYCAGDISLLKDKSVAIVGSRRHTIYGKNVSLMIGRRLGEANIPVTSGLALGIDGFSHEGALEGGGRVIGVLGGGIEVMGPIKNKNLMMRGLDAGGLVISEYEPTFPPKPSTFPARNRIISGLSEALIVVEAGMRSGSLITANHALQQGRPVYAVPGPINSQFSIGTNLLIRDGAIPLVLIDDLLYDLNIYDEGEQRKSAKSKLSEDELEIFEAISRLDGATVDEIVKETGKTAAFVNAIVTILEIKGIIETCGGRIYIVN